MIDSAVSAQLRGFICVDTQLVPIKACITNHWVGNAANGVSRVPLMILLSNMSSKIVKDSSNHLN